MEDHALTHIYTQYILYPLYNWLSKVTDVIIISLDFKEVKSTWEKSTYIEYGNYNYL